jgi:hypothetical protein
MASLSANSQATNSAEPIRMLKGIAALVTDIRAHGA